jgi:hypothetical protein
MRVRACIEGTKTAIPSHLNRTLSGGQLTFTSYFPFAKVTQMAKAESSVHPFGAVILRKAIHVEFDKHLHQILAPTHLFVSKIEEALHKKFPS